jgi:cyclopropane fatty-acyl-phospholipid synthase-like methyltransferase
VAESARYDAYYFAHDCGTPYERNDEWLGFFDRVAEWIVRTIGPASVLDAGSAFGFLVEKLRERGVDAWGIDVSEHAVAQVAPEVAPYCRVGSILAPFGRRYDLIVCMEVLEHLTPAEGRAAIANFAAHTDELLFSSTPHDFQEITHQNVQPPDYWAALFAEQGLFRDPDYDATFITDWAMRFRRRSGPVSNLIAAYERRLWRLELEAQARRALAFSQRDDIIRLEQEVVRYRWLRTEFEEALAAFRLERAALHEEMGVIRHQLEWRVQQVGALQAWHDSVVASPGWQVATSLQRTRAALTPPGSRRERWLAAGLGRAGLGTAPGVAETPAAGGEARGAVDADGGAP